MSILETSEITKSFGNNGKKIIALNNINLTIEQGDFLALIGLNGAGKTTLIRILSGILYPDHGSVSLFHKKYDKDEKYIKKRIGIVMGGGGHSLYGKLTGAENMEFFGSFYGLSKKEIRKQTDYLFQILDLSAKKDCLVETYSMGMKQKLLVAKSLLHNPELLIFDEPCNGIDIVTNFEIKKLLKELNANGKTIILTTHNLNDAEDLCNKVCILQKGQIITSGVLDDVYASYYTSINIELISKEKLSPSVLSQFNGNNSFIDVLNEENDGIYTYNFIFKPDAQNPIEFVLKKNGCSNILSIMEKKLSLELLIKSYLGKDSN